MLIVVRTVAARHSAHRGLRASDQYRRRSDRRLPLSPKLGGEHASFGMGRRGSGEKPKAVLTEAGPLELRAQLALMSVSQIEIRFKSMHSAVKYDDIHVSDAALVKEFVATWKALRRAKKRG
jgi:hypothetical protein